MTTRSQIDRPGDPGPAIVVLRSDAGIEAPLRMLTELLAEAVATCFGDTVLVAHVGPPGKEPRDYLPRSSARADYVFVVEPEGGPDARRSVDPLVTHLVHLSRRHDGAIDLPSERCELRLRTVLLDGAPPSLDEAKVSWPLAIARGMTADLCRGPRDLDARVEPYPSARVVPAPFRARLDLAAIARMARPRLRDLPSSLRATFERWARALTGRRVGLALGGAGAFGYACAALMLALEERGVPIDLIGGASSGAILGAYWCVGGRAGIERIVARGPAIARLMGAMALTSAPAQYMIDADLGGARVEALEVPLFPIVTNLTQRRPEVVTRGTVGLAGRASASAPGVFAPTPLSGQLYVDGAVSDNVPAALLEAMGADLVIAANPLPASTMPRRRHPGQGRLGHLAASLDPLGRLTDLAVGFHMLLHEAGNRPPSARRVTYAAEPVMFPLASTFDFGAARRIVEAARGDARLLATIDACVEAWDARRRERRREPRLDT